MALGNFNMQEGRRRRPGDRAIRHPRLREIRPVRVRLRPPRTPSRQTTSPYILMYGFAGLIAVGTLLLMLPMSSANGEFTTLVNALFTATSAVTVTGLVVVNTGEYWSSIGQAIILVLIFLGGLGFMTTTVFFLTVIGQRIGLAGRLAIRESVGTSSLGGIVQLTRNIVLLAAALQFLGFIALTVRLSSQFSLGTAMWQAGFHSVSGFNNAGFTILPNSQGLSAFSGDMTFLGIMGVLIVAGGLSYGVMADIFGHRRFTRLSLDTQLVLLLSVILWFIGALAFYFFESNNSGTIANLPLHGQITDTVFQSVSGRTAGFTTVDFGATHPGTNFLYLFLIFIGGAAASTAGGIKVNTLGVLVTAVVSAVRGRPHVAVFGKEIRTQQVYRALAVAALALSTVFVMSLLVTLLTPGGFDSPTFLQLIFETVSAFGANGTSTGITAELTEPVLVVLAVTMFLGRLGLLTFALALSQREKPAAYRYSQEHVKIG